MSYDEGWFPEPFGADYERPPAIPCRRCSCCSERLCNSAAYDKTTCSARSDDPEIVAGCPCTADDAARGATLAFAEGLTS